MIGSRESPVGTAPARGAGAGPVYVYGIARPGGPRETEVRAVDGAGLQALVTDVPDGWRTAGRADLEAHDRVLAELIDHETVVPMRFGVVMGSDEEVRERLLEPHADELTALLDTLEGHVQMSVKAYYVDDGLLREVLRRRPWLKRRADALSELPVAASQQQRIGLGRDVAEAVEEQRALDEQMLAAPLAALAADVRIQPSPSDRQAASIQLLVAADRRPALDAAVADLAREHGDRFAIRYVGPVPPYSFADIVLGEA
jgi:hypothetical protein